MQGWRGCIVPTPFKEFKWPAGTSLQVATTDNSHSPTAAELPLISEITIRANVNDDGFQRELACVVRLRNRPYKLHL